MKKEMTTTIISIRFAALASARIGLVHIISNGMLLRSR